MGILAYKGFESDLTCRGFKYEIGKTYKLPEGEAPVLCENGFHASLSLRDVFSFYPPNSIAYEISTRNLMISSANLVLNKQRTSNRYCVVELDGFRVSSFWAVNGATAQASHDKLCAAQITIKEEVPLSDYELNWLQKSTYSERFAPHALTYTKERYVEVSSGKFFKKNEENGLWYECSEKEEGAVNSEEFFGNVFDISSLLELSFSRKIPGL